MALPKSNRLSRGGPGGGHGSKNVVHKPVRTGQQRERIRYAGVAQIGQHQGSHVTEQDHTSYKGINAFGAGQGYPSKLGNELVNNIGAGGPGKGRTLYGQSGMQGMHGKPNPGNPTPSGELFPGWPAKRS